MIFRLHIDVKNSTRRSSSKFIKKFDMKTNLSTEHSDSDPPVKNQQQDSTKQKLVASKKER